jgi:hypothetical protein
LSPLGGRSGLSIKGNRHLVATLLDSLALSRGRHLLDAQSETESVAS